MQQLNKPEKAQVYVVSFLSAEDTSAILAVLQSRCEALEFVAVETPGYPGKDSLDYALQINADTYVDDSRNNAILEDIRNRKEALDGLFLLFGGFCDRRFLLTELPTLLVDYNAFPTLQIGFKNAFGLAKRLGTKFVTASYSTTDLSEEVAKARLDDLVQKANLFAALSKIKNSRILDVQVRGFGSEPHEHWWRLDQEVYLHKLRESLGLTVDIVDYRDLFKLYGQVSDADAKALATKWLDGQSTTASIRNTRNVGGVTEEEVVKVARVYLAADSLLKERGCNAVTMDASTWAGRTAFAQSIGEPYLVSSSLALMEFRLHGVVACCQSDMQGIVTQVVGESLSGRPGLHGDLTIDPFNGVTQVCHCNAPINPYGDDYRAPYSIGGEPLRRPQQYVDLPQEGAATVYKLNVLEQKGVVWTGELIPGESIYKDFFESCCCTKLIVRTNASSVYERYDYRTFGNHPSCFYGDYRDQIKNLAALTGFEVLEADKPV
jgi:hypothetical protein